MKLNLQSRVRRSKVGDVFGISFDGGFYGVVAGGAGGMRGGFFFGLGLSLAVGGAYL